MDRALKRLSGPVGSSIAISTVLGLLVTAAYVAQGVFLAAALAALFTGAAQSEVMKWLFAFTAVLAGRALLIWAAEWSAQHTAQRTKEHLRARLLARVFELGPGGSSAWATGELQTTLIGGVEALEAYFSRYLPSVFIAIAGCAGVLACLAWVDWPSALILGAFVIALPIADRLWLRWRMPKSSGIFAAMGAFAAYLLDSLQGIATLKAFDAAQRRRAVLAQRAATLRSEAMATLNVTLMRTGLTGLISLSGIACVLAVNTWRVSSGTLAPLALFMTLFLAREAFRPLDKLEKAFHTAWAGSGAMPPMIALLDAPRLVDEPATPQPMPKRADVEFDAVTFTYPQSDQAALVSACFRVREREFVALVGPSGAGKSTVIALLLRWFDPQGGAIRIGGVDIRNLPLQDLRSLISVVSQDTYLFHGTIEDNLRIAKPHASLEEIEAAARIAHIDELIASLPRGYATEIGERGAELSGGQRQRLAIARAVLKNAPILLLDEATSNVDPASDRAIQAALDELARQRTTLVIAHRLSTIRRADRVLVLEAGRLIEQGRHMDLLAREGRYATLYSLGEPA